MDSAVWTVPGAAQVGGADDAGTAVVVADAPAGRGAGRAGQREHAGRQRRGHQPPGGPGVAGGDDGCAVGGQAARARGAGDGVEPARGRDGRRGHAAGPQGDHDGGGVGQPAGGEADRVGGAVQRVEGVDLGGQLGGPRGPRRPAVAGEEQVAAGHRPAGRDGRAGGGRAVAAGQLGRDLPGVGGGGGCGCRSGGRSGRWALCWALGDPGWGPDEDCADEEGGDGQRAGPPPARRLGALHGTPCPGPMSGTRPGPAADGTIDPRRGPRHGVLTR